MPVAIGSKYTGQYKGFHNTEAGEYWEVLPPIGGDALLIQRALLERRAPTPTKVGTQQSAHEH